MKPALLIICLSCSFFSPAQRAFFGISGGMNISGVQSGSAYENAKSRNGFFAVITYTRFLRPHLTLGFDAQYTQYGFQNAVSMNGPGGSYIGLASQSKYHFDYFALPVKIGLHTGKRVVVFANIGAVPAVLMKAEVFFREWYEAEPGDRTDITSRPDRIDLSGLLEVGSGVYLTKNLLFTLSVTARHGITSYTNKDYLSKNYIYHRSISFSAGLKLAFDKDQEK